MANLKYGQDVANKREKIYTTAKVAKSYPLSPAVQTRRYLSLITINPSATYDILHSLSAVLSQAWFLYKSFPEIVATKNEKSAERGGWTRIYSRLVEEEMENVKTNSKLLLHVK